MPNHSYHQRYADCRSARFRCAKSVPLQINPHFTNALPEGHKGETREQRIRELLVVAPELTIIGLPEGNWITVSKGHATLGGPNTTYVFKAGEEAVPLEAGHRF